MLAFNSGFRPDDIAMYADSAGIRQVPVDTVLVDGYGGGLGEEAFEVELDIEMVNAMAPGLDSTIVFEGQFGSSIISAMAAHPTIKQLSSSWRWSDDYAGQAYMQLVAQGQSFLQASGDEDAIWPPVPPGADYHCDELNILMPYATVVGGTTLTTDGTADQHYVSEMVWNYNGNGYCGSEGGYCYSMPIPRWQEGVADSANGASTHYRNIPDVACVAAHVRSTFPYLWPYWTEAYGTSIGAPLWAGFVALVNEDAQTRGLTSVGWLNPFLYHLGMSAAGNDTTYFHDITVGNNRRPGSGDHFDAVAGYDLCTGWGTLRPALMDTLYALSAVDAATPTATPLLARVSPNPSHGGCRIQIYTPSPGSVSVYLFDPAGRALRRLQRDVKEVGPVSLQWDGRDDRGRNLAAGVYFARIKGPAGSAQQKVVLIQ